MTLRKKTGTEKKHAILSHFAGSFDYSLAKGAVLTIGSFDGVHMGHRQLINIVIQSARYIKKPAVLYTFSPHPAQFLFPEKKHKLLCSLEKTEEILCAMGLDGLIVEPFTSSFSKLSPEEFIEKHIVAPIQPTLIVVGYNFRFGADGAGSSQLLEKLKKKHNFRLKVIPPIKKGDVIISSSFIKKAVLSGDWDVMPALLGRPFSIKGLVVKGEGRGKKLGFPTINLEVDKNILLPWNGVYIARVKGKNQYFYAVINIGTNPTFLNNCLKKIEVHIIGGSEQWKDKECEVDILKYIRPEKTFSGAGELIHQIKQDIEQAKKYFHFLNIYTD